MQTSKLHSEISLHRTKVVVFLSRINNNNDFIADLAMRSPTWPIPIPKRPKFDVVYLHLR